MALVRQINLTQFGSFGRNLRDTLIRAGVSPNELDAVVEAHLCARCVVCGAAVSGSDLAEVLLAPETAEPVATGRLARLHLGYCVGSGCKARYFEFSFAPHPAIDWTQIPALSQSGSEPRVRRASSIGLMARAAWQILMRQLTWRVGAGVAVLLALWFLRQWTTGGSIPLIREPRTFTSEATTSGEPVPDADPDC